MTSYGLPDHYIDHDEYYENRDGGKEGFCPDPFHYHIKYPINGIEHTTEKAYLLQDNKGLFWAPKVLCKMDVSRKAMYIHKSFNPHYLEE